MSSHHHSTVFYSSAKVQVGNGAHVYLLSLPLLVIQPLICYVTWCWQMRLKYSQWLLTVVSLWEEEIQWVLFFSRSQTGSRLRWWLPMTRLTHFCLLHRSTVRWTLPLLYIKLSEKKIQKTNFCSSFHCHNYIYDLCQAKRTTDCYILNDYWNWLIKIKATNHFHI